MVTLVPVASAAVPSAVIGVSVFIGIIGVGLCAYLVIKKLLNE